MSEIGRTPKRQRRQSSQQTVESPRASPSPSIPIDQLRIGTPSAAKRRLISRSPSNESMSAMEQLELTPSAPAIEYPPPSTFVATDRNVTRVRIGDEDVYLAGFNDGDRLCFQGSCLVAAVKGACNVAGFTVQSATNPKKPSAADLAFYRTFSPRSHALLSIQPCDSGIGSLDAAAMAKRLKRHGCTEWKLNPTSDEEAKFSKAVKSLSKTASAIVAIRAVPGHVQASGLTGLTSELPFCKNLFEPLPVVSSSIPTSPGPEGDMQIDESPPNSILDITGFYPVHTRSANTTVLSISEQWQEGAVEFANETGYYDSNHVFVPPVAVVCGPLNSGKSTFLRYLINTMLQTHDRIVLLDTDMGQPEITPPGFVSLNIVQSPLLGPPYANCARVPYRSAFLAKPSPVDVIMEFRTAVTTLMDVYRTKFGVASRGGSKESAKTIPLVVNTGGWVKGLGLDLLKFTIATVEPSHVIRVRKNDAMMFDPLETLVSDTVMESAAAEASSDPSSSAASAFTEESSLRMPREIVLEAEITASAPANTNTGNIRLMEANHYRVMSLMSHFHAVPASWLYPNKAVTWNFDMPLAAMPPWMVPWTTLELRVVEDYDVPLSQTLYAWNGMIVGLVCPLPDESNTEASSSSLTIDDGSEAIRSNKNTEHPQRIRLVRSLPDPSKTTCIGLGIVRAIDPSRSLFYISTAVPVGDLDCTVTTLVLASEMEVPLWIQTAAIRKSAIKAQPMGIRPKALQDSTSVDVPIVAPYLSTAALEGAGSAAKHIRRNLQRRGQAT